MASGQQTIYAFGRISKTSAGTLIGKKRKATSDDGNDEKRNDITNTSCTKRAKFTQIHTDTPTKTIGLKFARLELAQRPTTPNGRRPQTAWTASELTPPLSPQSPRSQVRDDLQFATLPREVVDLKALGAAMLNALSLHYAHHGTASPLNVQDLLPSVTRLWGRRQVLLADVQRIIGVLQSAPSRQKCPLRLTHYGVGSIYVECVASIGKAGQAIRFNQQALLALFDQCIEQAWLDWLQLSSGPPTAVVDDSACAFIDQLPRAAAEASSTMRRTAQAMMQMKGQKRLRDVLEGRDNISSGLAGSLKRQRTIQTQTEDHSQSQDCVMSNAEQPLVEGSSSPQALSDRSQSLLDRIRAKQLHAASLTAAPTREQLLHVAALQRIEDISSILDMLVAQRGQGPRASFPLQSLMQNIQSSLRSPMSRDEIERCLVVIQDEIAVGYVKVLRLGSLQSVIINTLQKPRKDVLQERLRRAGA